MSAWDYKIRKLEIAWELASRIIPEAPQPSGVWTEADYIARAQKVMKEAGAMTRETRIVFGLEDLVSVRFQCSKCQGELVQHLNGLHWYLPGFCPMCQVSLDKEMVDRDGMDELVLLIRRLSKVSDPKIKLQLELDGAAVEAE